MVQPMLGKRRRTVRACVHCRRHKTKCDGGRPCYRCQTSENVCWYDSPDQRVPTALYIQSLERKVCDLEKLVDPQATPSDKLDGLIGTTDFARLSSGSDENPTESPSQSSAPSEPLASEEAVIETMIGSREEVLIDTRSLEHYRASFAGLSLLQRVQDMCRNLSGVSRDAISELEDDFVRAFDFAPPSYWTMTSFETLPLLPLSVNMDHAIDVVVNEVCSNMQFLDPQNLRSLARQVYVETEFGSPNNHRKSLSLLYAILALARRFEVVPCNATVAAGQGATYGLRYFCASRAMIDPTDCHDLVSLQALLCMILYTQASSMMSTCYSYICMAVAAALRMGLFMDATIQNMSESEKLCRRRIFTVLNIMDTYVTIALGLPKTLRDIESDQSLPTPTKPLTATDPLAGTYAHAQLVQILATAVESNHPVTRPISQKNGFYGVEYHRITAIEDRLEAWFAQLPPFPDTTGTGDDAAVVRTQLLLRLSYAQVQMVLYKPFLHHVLKYVRWSGNLSLKAYACGSACIEAAMQVVWLAEKLEACNLFNEAYWFMTLILAFTAACLALFVISNKKDPTFDETSDAVRRIKELRTRYADRNPSMQCCAKFLESLPTNTEGFHDTGVLEWWGMSTQDPINTFGRAYEEADAAAGDDFSSSGLLQALFLPPCDAHSSRLPLDI